MSRTERTISSSPFPASKAALLAAGITLFVGVGVIALHPLGPQSRHMALHIASMNVAAPVFAALLVGCISNPPMVRLPIWPLAIAQVGLVWMWHVPFIHDMAMASHGLHGALQAGLFLVALLFWLAIIRADAPERWHGVAALLITGKLVCLLSALLIFSPRSLYGAHFHEALSNASLSIPPTLDDQQLAGLLMITACPLTYLVAAGVIAIQLIDRSAPRSAPARSASIVG